MSPAAPIPASGMLPRKASAVAPIADESPGKDSGNARTAKSAPLALALDTMAAIIVDDEANASVPRAVAAASRAGFAGRVSMSNKNRGTTMAATAD